MTATISEQILIETGRMQSVFDKAPLSSCFYECLFIGYSADNRKICRLIRQLREADTVTPRIKAGAFRIHLVLPVRKKQMQVPMDEHLLFCYRDSRG